jgi:carbonic anhydrase
MTITHDEASQQKMTGERALQLLKEGNQRFLDHRFLHRDFEAQRQATAAGQYPFAVILSCIDSRLPTEIIFDQGIGDIFNVRIAGNVINEDVLGSVEFACKLAGAKLLLVLGHTSCGAVKGACDHVEMGKLTGLLSKITPAVNAVKTPSSMVRDSSNEAFVDDVARENVSLSMENILQESAILKEMIASGELKMAGAMYDIESGVVSFDIPA